MLADLHTHTTFSDGRLSPPGIVEKASLRGIGVLAVTDHDSVGAYPLAAAAASAHGIRLIPGVELSAEMEGADVHLLGYGFDPSHRELRAHLAAYREGRLQRARATVVRLEELGAPVSLERVLDFADGGAVGRPHVARALVEAGHVKTMSQAFDEFLGDDRPAYVPKPPVPPATLIDLVHRAGGVCVLAHPGARISEPMVLDLAARGLDGIEAVHPSHGELMADHWRATAARLGLLTTGGSDYHGYRPGDEEAFGAFGVLAESLSWLERCWAGQVA